MVALVFKRSAKAEILSGMTCEASAVSRTLRHFAGQPPAIPVHRRIEISSCHAVFAKLRPEDEYPRICQQREQRETATSRWSLRCCFATLSLLALGSYDTCHLKMTEVMLRNECTANDGWRIKGRLSDLLSEKSLKRNLEAKQAKRDESKRLSIEVYRLDT